MDLCSQGRRRAKLLKWRFEEYRSTPYVVYTYPPINDLMTPLFTYRLMSPDK